MKTLTVFTPAYNREKLLPRLYDSLKEQTKKDFVWIIVDDGSSDTTKLLVQKWIDEEKGFEIKYIYKENGGLHTGYNTAIAKLETELAVCIDSDDYMPNDAVERIISLWKKCGADEYAGIVGLDFTPDGKCIGARLPDKKSLNIIELMTKYRKTNGDRKIVVRSELYKEVAPLETIEGEKNFNPHYMHLQIASQREFLVLNENLCFICYQNNGMTNNIFRQFANSPNSFAQTRRLYMTLPNVPYWFVFKNAVYYVSSCIIARKYGDIIKKSPKKITTLIAFPLGYLFSLYVKRKAKQ